MKEGMKESYKVEGLEKIDIDMIHTKAEKILEEASFKETDFIENPYSREMVERDLALIAQREKSWGEKENSHQKETKKVATIFEAIIFEHAELSEWLGEDSFTIKTSKYDDYENGVDAIVEFREQESPRYLGLAMDVTFSSDPNSGDGMTKKFDRIFSQIQKGTLTKIRYFHAKNKNINIHGQLNDVPEVVIGADKSTVLELAELMNGKKSEMLAEHKIQIMILKQMEAQLNVFIALAIREKKMNLAEIFHQRLLIIEGILEEKSDLVRKHAATLNQDQVHYAMMNFLKRKLEEVTRTAI